MPDKFVCSDASVARGEPVVATASQVGAWLLIEVPGAWGIDALVDSELGPHLPAGWESEIQRRGIRPVCIRPSLRSDPAASGARVFFVVCRRPGTGPPGCWSVRTPTLAAVPYIVDDLVVPARADAPATDRAAAPGTLDGPLGWQRHDERIVLVCTNGRHDQCCATLGRPVVRHLRETSLVEQVWECSHIGGDRFAANVVVLPDSLYFGRVDGPQTEELLTAHAGGRIDRRWFRGASTYRYIEQAADHALREEYGLDGIDDVVVLARPSPGLILARVAGLGTVEVAVERTTVHVDAALTCRGRPGQDIPVFTATSFTPTS